MTGFCDEPDAINIVPESVAEGVIVAQGGLTGRWGLYAKGSKLKYCYDF